MHKRHKLAVAAMGLVLTGCASVVNGAHDGYSVAERHPVTVDQQTTTLLVPVDGTREGLARADLAAIEEFVSTYRTRGYGPITVTAPGSAREAGQTAAEVRRALFAAGVPYEAMRGASIRRGGGDAVVVSFQAYVASAPACGVSRGELASRLTNRPHPSFGCATQANLAAMIADPRDLHQATPDDGTGDAALADGAVAARGQ